ncbi:hypothetical protein VCHENC02_0837B, partial [Vibrio harveyi]
YNEELQIICVFFFAMSSY